jgi:hypothetical protein
MTKPFGGKMSAKKYQAISGFAAVGEDKVKRYFSPSNSHEIADLPDAEIKKHLKAGNIAEINEKTAEPEESVGGKK